MSSTFNDDKVDRHIEVLDRLITSPDVIEGYKEHLRSIRRKASLFRGQYKTVLSIEELEALWTVKQLMSAGILHV